MMLSTEGILGIMGFELRRKGDGRWRRGVEGWVCGTYGEDLYRRRICGRCGGRCLSVRMLLLRGNLLFGFSLISHSAIDKLHLRQRKSKKALTT